jgi:hypothetical protein
VRDAFGGYSAPFQVLHHQRARATVRGVWTTLAIASSGLRSRRRKPELSAEWFREAARLNAVV